MKRILWIWVPLIIAGSLLAAEFLTPTEQIKQSVDKIITILEDETLGREQRWEDISAIINDRFDFRSMSQSVLATNWQRATPEERERFVEFFSQYLEETYRTKIEAYSNQEVVYLKETINGKRAVVETVIKTEAIEIPINYKLKNNDGEWFSYDVVIEGVSLVNNYRSTFAAIVKNDGMDGLLNDIQYRINKYKQAESEKSSEVDISEYGY
jgi:phospholipid transport system substrate-binding protein